jgi:hypothetical protein
MNLYSPLCSFRQVLDNTARKHVLAWSAISFVEDFHELFGPDEPSSEPAKPPQPASPAAQIYAPPP